MGLAGRVRRLAGALQQKLMLIRTDAPQDMRRENAIDHHHMVGHPHMAVTARIARSPAIEIDGDRESNAHPAHLGEQGRVYSDIRTKIEPDGIAQSIRYVRHGLRPGEKADRKS